MFGLGGLWAKLAAAGAVLLAILAAVFKLISIGKKQQQATDAKVTSDVLQKQRDVAATPVDPATARQRLRDGNL